MLATLAVGCSSDGDTAGPDATTEATTAATVTVPSERLTPFCRAMIDLSDRLATDPPDDVNAYIVETYQGIAAEVPAEIANEFAAVLAALQTGVADTDGTVSTSTSDVSGADGPAPSASVDVGNPETVEGFTPSDDPALQLNAYVEFACRDSVNNPGPPATAPLVSVETTDDSTQS